MQFHQVTRRKTEVPIIPLIDILTILLIFILVTTKFKEPRPVLDIEVPLASGSGDLTQKISDSRSILSVAANGEISIDDVRVQPGTLLSYLKSFQTINPGQKLELKIDEGCPFGTMLVVWEALTEAGIGLKDVPHRVRLAEQSEDAAQ